MTPDNATNKKINWTSSDASIATVDQNGNVKAQKAGQVTITATAADGSGVKAECTVTVKEKADSGLKGSDNSGKTNPGEDDKPDKSVTPAQPEKTNQPTQTQDMKQDGKTLQPTENKTKVNRNKTVPAKTSQNTGSAKTGDMSQIALWFALMIMACGGLSAGIIYQRKQRG